MRDPPRGKSDAEEVGPQKKSSGKERRKIT